jgi:Kef-type K+ transport system membrane component KefB
MHPVHLANIITVPIVLVAAAAIPALLPRLPVPGVVLEILFGVLVGPQVLGLITITPTLDVLANLGLALLFLMAGFEVEPAVLRGVPIRLALGGWGMTVVLAAAAALTLAHAGLAQAWTFTALALTTTAIGSLMPVLRDQGLLAPPYGPLVLAAGAAGEAGPVIALSLVLAGQDAPVQAVVMIGFGAVSAAAVVLAGRAADGRLAAVVERSIGTSGQLPLRVAVCAMMMLVLLSENLGIDMVLGAFVAGAVARAALQTHHHETFSARLDGLGSGFLVPIFFLVSGVRLDVAALAHDPATLAMVPVYAALMLATRGLPVLLLYRDLLPVRQRLALALHTGTQLSLVVAITGLAVAKGSMQGGQGAALVGGGIVTMLLFPALATMVLGTRPAALVAGENT